MNRKSILVFTDRPINPLRVELEPEVLIYSAANLHEAREKFDRLPSLDTVVVHVEEGVERALEFCDIVHVTRPSLPIIFVRSPNRLSLVPRCAGRVLDPHATPQELAREIVALMEEPPASQRGA